MVGHDLTRPEYAQGVGRAIMQYYTSMAYLENDKVLVLQRDLSPRQFIYRDSDYGEESEPDEDMVSKALGYANWSDLAYENLWYRLPDPKSLLVAP